MTPLSTIEDTDASKSYIETDSIGKIQPFSLTPVGDASVNRLRQIVKYFKGFFGVVDMPKRKSHLKICPESQAHVIRTSLQMIMCRGEAKRWYEMGGVLFYSYPNITFALVGLFYDFNNGRCFCSFFIGLFEPFLLDFRLLCIFITKTQPR